VFIPAGLGVDDGSNKFKKKHCKQEQMRQNARRVRRVRRERERVKTKRTRRISFHSRDYCEKLK
jgi:hypothetical protein